MPARKWSTLLRSVIPSNRRPNKSIISKGNGSRVQGAGMVIATANLHADHQAMEQDHRLPFKVSSDLSRARFISVVSIHNREAYASDSSSPF